MLLAPRVHHETLLELPDAQVGAFFHVGRRLITAVEKAMDAAACIGCGACVAACPNAAAMLFTGAKISHLALLPQGRPEAAKRAIEMLRTMDGLGFGNCTNERECEAECPKEISITNIAELNRVYFGAVFGSEQEV